MANRESDGVGDSFQFQDQRACIWRQKRIELWDEPPAAEMPGDDQHSGLPNECQPSTGVDGELTAFDKAMAQRSRS